MQLVYGEGNRITVRPYFDTFNNTDGDVMVYQNAGHNVVDHFAAVSKMVKFVFGSWTSDRRYICSHVTCFLVAPMVIFITYI